MLEHLKFIVKSRKCFPFSFHHSEAYVVIVIVNGDKIILCRLDCLPKFMDEIYKVFSALEIFCFLGFI
jgi:hypothetical protein